MKDLSPLLKAMSPTRFQETLLELVEKDDFGVAEEESPNDMDTIGSLIDKLVTVDLKMWHNQERLYEIRRMTTHEFIERYGTQLDVLHEVVKRCCDLNVQRASLMDAIDRLVADVVTGKKEAAVRPQHKTY